MLAYPNHLIIEVTGQVSGVGIEPVGEQSITCECGDLVSAAGEIAGERTGGEWDRSYDVLI